MRPDFGGRCRWSPKPGTAGSNDINGFHVKPEHAFHALDSAHAGPVEEGSVGGGTGMICNGYKGGIGTSFAPSRCGRPDLHGRGARAVQLRNPEQPARRRRSVGREIPAPEPYAFMPSDIAERGSIIVVVATDAPLLAHQLKRLAHRVNLGAGPQRQHFRQRFRRYFHRVSPPPIREPPCRTMWSIFRCCPTTRSFRYFAPRWTPPRRAIVNAMVAAQDMTGADDHRVIAQPHEKLREVLKKYGRLAP